MSPRLMLVFLVACADVPTGTPPKGTEPVVDRSGTPPASAQSAPEVFEARRKALNVEVQGLIADLEAAGRYDCCTLHPCKHCSLIAGGCRCGEGLRGGDPVCEECARMWEQGQGAEAVPPESVRSFTEVARFQTGKICGQQRLTPGSTVRPPSTLP